jgi:hypothetical protein
MRGAMLLAAQKAKYYKNNVGKINKVLEQIVIGN